MKVILASNNAHKRGEMVAILSSVGSDIELLSPGDFSFSFDAEENFDTFRENAFVKAASLIHLQRGIIPDGTTASESAETIARRINDAGGPFPVLADDSGISVVALQDRPGVFSARYGADQPHPPADDRARAELLVSNLGDQIDRRAYYTASVVLMMDRFVFYHAQATWHGEIAREYVDGGGGFGYDPVFWLPDYRCTVSRLPQEQKDRISHRAQAVAAVMRAAAIT